MKSLRKVNVTELRQNLPTYLAAVAKGSEIEVTSHGRVIARIVAVGDPAQEARDRLRALGERAIIGDIVSPADDIWEAER